MVSVPLGDELDKVEPLQAAVALQTLVRELGAGEEREALFEAAIAVPRAVVVAALVRLLVAVELRNRLVRITRLVCRRFTYST